MGYTGTATMGYRGTAMMGFMNTIPEGVQLFKTDPNLQMS